MTPTERLDLHEQIAHDIERLVRAGLGAMKLPPTLNQETGDMEKLDFENVTPRSFTVAVGGDWQRGILLTFSATGRLVRAEHILEG